jgi:hypothetical protein
MSPNRCANCGAEQYDDHASTCPDRIKPVARQYSSLTRRTPLKAKQPWRPQRKPLKHRSAKTARIYVERRALVKELLESTPHCEARWDDGCTVRSVDVHEILPRSQGGRIVGGERSEYLVVCRYCHDKIETHPTEAHERGFRRWSWERDE